MAQPRQERSKGAAPAKTNKRTAQRAASATKDQLLALAGGVEGDIGQQECPETEARFVGYVKSIPEDAQVMIAAEFGGKAAQKLHEWCEGKLKEATDLLDNQESLSTK